MTIRKINIRPRSRIKAGARRALKNSSEFGNMELRYDYSRRLRNAIMLFKQLTPHWRAWCNRHLKRRRFTASEAAKAVETKVAAMVINGSWKGFGFNPSRFMITDNLSLVGE